MANENENLDLYFLVWCDELGYTISHPYRIHQLIAETAENTARFFIAWYDKHNYYPVAKIVTEDLIIYVQDWRGIISKFTIDKIETKHNYILRKIQ